MIGGCHSQKLHSCYVDVFEARVCPKHIPKPCTEGLMSSDIHLMGEIYVGSRVCLDLILPNGVADPPPINPDKNPGVSAGRLGTRSDLLVHFFSFFPLRGEGARSGGIRAMQSTKNGGKPRKFGQRFGSGSPQREEFAQVPKGKKFLCFLPIFAGFWVCHRTAAAARPTPPMPPPPPRTPAARRTPPPRPTTKSPPPCSPTTRAGARKEA